ncbi:hypothetical protein AB0F59_02425 [Micromonospora lupini]|uniref:hypothetical protein n=1 Tax=Micromonospora lupini TaxID=285679 RepID=UPI00340E31B6
MIDRHHAATLLLVRTPSEPAEQASVIFDYVQGKRRLERVIESATVLADRHATQPDGRLKRTYEFVRRNISDDVHIAFGEMSMGARPDDMDDPEIYRVEFVGRTGTAGLFVTRYSPGRLGLSRREWRAALDLVTSITLLGIGASRG